MPRSFLLPTFRPSRSFAPRARLSLGLWRQRELYRPRSWRRPPHRPLCQAKAPQHRRKEALEDSAVILSGQKWPPRSSPPPALLPCRISARMTTRAPGHTVNHANPLAICDKNVRNMLESCDNRARRKKKWRMFRRHAEWPKVADAVIDAALYKNVPCLRAPAFFARSEGGTVGLYTTVML